MTDHTFWVRPGFTPLPRFLLNKTTEPIIKQIENLQIPRKLYCGGGGLSFHILPVFNLLFRLYLGMTDATLETVFRTSEGFTTPWANWHVSSPNDAMLNAVEDCVRRQPSSGKWDDFRCTNTEKYYCLGENMFQQIFNCEIISLTLSCYSMESNIIM